MGNDFRQTSLWKNAFASRSKDSKKRERERLRTAYENFRERAAALASEIPRDLPYFTVHDITHLDALWEMADLIAGPDYPLTPTEAFVLGGAILVHDLAMSKAAFQHEWELLRKEPVWMDTVARLLRQKHDRPATPEEIASPDPETVTAATQTLLRELHARQAESLPRKQWHYAGSQFYLIDDADLRGAFAFAIGKVAHSHHWPAEKLLDPEFLNQKPLGAPGWLPGEWTVDLVKLACLLRTADACHADDRRAPAFLAALREPTGESARHWRFQSLYNRPFREPDQDRLRFSAKEPFTTEIIDSWWYGYDWVRMLDRELRSVDRLLTDTGRKRLAARGVWNVDDPARFATDIPTKGWAPVDARIRVDDVGQLTRMLGGEQLYGRSNGTVPLRELIQNAADAVRARRKRPGQLADHGKITVRLSNDPDGQEWVEVEDDGIGMSARVLTGALLDFGGSFWGTAAMRSEFPGLETAGLETTGRFGIGFFSVFMWGDRVEVLSRRYDAATADAQVLEFRGGTSLRPVLRPGSREEQNRLPNGGTVVRVWIDSSHDSLNRLAYRLSNHNIDKIINLIIIIIISLSINVTVYVELNESIKCAVISDDWLNIDANKLVDRIEDDYHFDEDSVRPQKDWAVLTQLLRILKDDNGRIFGRATLWSNSGGVVTVGGFRAQERSDLPLGIYLGHATRASRDDAEFHAPSEVWRVWAAEQASLDDSTKFSIKTRLKVARKCARFGEVDKLPICISKIGGLSIDQFKL